MSGVRGTARGGEPRPSQNPHPQNWRVRHRQVPGFSEQETEIGNSKIHT